MYLKFTYKKVQGLLVLTFYKQSYTTQEGYFIVPHPCNDETSARAHIKKCKGYWC